MIRKCEQEHNTEYGGVKPVAPPPEPKPPEDALDTIPCNETEDDVEKERIYSVPLYTKCVKCGKEIADTYIVFRATANVLNSNMGVSAPGAVFNLNDSFRGLNRKRKAYCMECGRKIYDEIV